MKEYLRAKIGQPHAEVSRPCETMCGRQPIPECRRIPGANAGRPEVPARPKVRAVLALPRCFRRPVSFRGDEHRAAAPQANGFAATMMSGIHGGLHQLGRAKCTPGAPPRRIGFSFKAQERVVLVSQLASPSETKALFMGIDAAFAFVPLRTTIPAGGGPWTTCSNAVMSLPFDESRAGKAIGSKSRRVLLLACDRQRSKGPPIGRSRAGPPSSKLLRIDLAAVGADHP